MSKRENFIVVVVCALLSVVGMILFGTDNKSLLTIRNHGFIFPAAFIVGYTFIRVAYILLFGSVSKEEVEEHIKSLKAKGKLPKDYNTKE